jgi:hypothetical protein
MNNIRTMAQAIRHFLVICLALCAVSVANAQSGTVFKMTVDKPMNDVYDNVYTSLEEARFFVVFEPNIGKNIAGFAERWGDEYNQNALAELSSMVFCNAWYANQVSNKEPDMLGLCPLHISLFERDGNTTVLFNRPTIFAADSQAHTIIQEIESKVIAAIKKGMEK